eukprot:GHVU01215693.1.p1 GENE.GHVU01215693.1~~GHVU01215693.1.p1  ORF type:complete len:135 (-),score=2.77 GHVU01215693.1:334-738(-)
MDETMSEGAGAGLGVGNGGGQPTCSLSVCLSGWRSSQCSAVMHNFVRCIMGLFKTHVCSCVLAGVTTEGPKAPPSMRERRRLLPVKGAPNQPASQLASQSASQAAMCLPSIGVGGQLSGSHVEPRGLSKGHRRR